ncbi:MAG: family 78 glycoside hydrolase catalytic domain [Bacteroidetes bacterium]|nr:family 78 glycoside hydrolase catalytic domain [Bacteroidota bacterium]
MRYLFGFLALFSFCMTGMGQEVCRPVDLRTEYLEDPLGIDEAHPRFSWKLMDERRGARQTAYEVVVGTDSLLVEKGSGVWSSGRQLSAAQLVSYEGPALRPWTRYYWRVTVEDKDGKKGGMPGVASFETGMMGMGNWRGAWISDSRDIQLKPAAYFRKPFRMEKKVRSARAYIAAAGLYELYINGAKVGNHRLDPMYTRFDRRNLYVTYDITNYLQQGENAVGVLLGNGWYNMQSTAVWYFHEAPWRARPCMCMDIRINYEDGSTETICSGKDWKTSLSPIVFNSIYTGEHVDDRRVQEGWDRPGFNDSAWKEVIFRSAPSGNVAAQVMPPIRDVERIMPVTMKRLNDTVVVYDLGRNIAGVSELHVSGPAGARMRLVHGERLYPNGHVDQSNISVHYRPVGDGDPFQTDIYILKGGGEEVFKPLMGYKGFQYVEVVSSSPDVRLNANSLTGWFMHSDVQAAGRIESSDTLVNRLWAATNNSYLSNFMGYPTDCPQREKNGWTGDAHIAVETGLYNFNGIKVYEKWMADHRDEQQPNGVLPSIIPTDGWGYEWGNGPDWTSTIALIPWNIYMFYGDPRLLRDCYDNIRRYVDHIELRGENGRSTGLTDWGLGDWIPVTTKPPVEFTSTVYYYTDARILARAAGLLGKKEDEKKYRVLAEKIRTAFNARYLDRAKGVYGSGLQTEQCMPLYWGLVPDDMRAKVAASLARRVEADGNHLNVGLLGTKALLSALSENGYADLAYTVATQRTYPSWGWWIVNGATTLYENWPIDAKSDISMNHIMFGEIGAWLFKGLGGILPDAGQPGFRHILLRPHFAKGLERFRATHESPYGEIVSSWKTDGGKIVYAAVVPAGATAQLELPWKKVELVAGRYEFREP